MRTFTWCRQELAEGCKSDVSHVHICITTTGSHKIHPACGRKHLNLFFVDLDPFNIMRMAKATDDPKRACQIASDCFDINHAEEIKRFVGETADHENVIVNCEAGISRSPAVVLALRRFYGAENTDDCFELAHPNMHVAGVLEMVLRMKPMSSGSLFVVDTESHERVTMVQMKHGIYSFEDSIDKAYSFYWLGELVSEVEFNGRLRARMKLPPMQG